ncbi:DUF3300 domain-containing protein [Herminiimonas sp. KBW02]|uniref:DUF3300 domain-containing protein n=1 Tax=Herminiimonas sp. KBW02 TaxID=2153363 RepID=UPI000F5A6320|nr:DUF3300 domain-containing protein [Herminiimonas sp. KBW02]RQO36487.1 DUF3300 domain-containing protein [Herminiimonas sp. KBW02]
MKAGKNTFTTVVSSSLIISLLALAACNKTQDSKAADPVAVTPSPQLPTAPVYTPPTAEQLTQMVAPIALFPDKLLAQVLAGAQYPDQISAANLWLTQNPALKGNALQDAANQQAWDVSVKSLTAFPAVLSQMANNIQWTTALGTAYANAPNDVMNAVQTMRLRAQQSGNLKNSNRLKVTSSARLAPPPEYADDARYYAVPPPPQTIVIESAQPDVVYVPDYNPALVYGAPIPVYPSYVYHPGYGGNYITTGIISFGIGVIVGSALTHHGGWGWHSWGMNWGGHGPGYGPNYGPGNGWARPAVTYNNTVYAPRSSITINRNYDTRITTNNFGDAGRPPVSGNVHDNANDNRPNFGNPNQHRPPPNNGPMSMPHFSAADQHPGARPAAPVPTQQFHANRPASALPAREEQLRQRERRQDNRPRSETGERLNSADMQGSHSRHSLSTAGRPQTAPERSMERMENRSPTSLRSGDVQHSGINQRHEEFRQQSRPEPRPYNPPAAPQMNPQPQVHQQMQQMPQPQAPQFRPAPPQQMAHPQEPRIQAPRPPQHMQERVQQERPQQHVQERPRPAPRQEEHREGR